jgi:hypothetical protein
LQDLVNDLEIEEDYCAGSIVGELRRGNQTKDIETISETLAHRKEFRKKILKGADPGNAEVVAALLHSVSMD